MGVWGRNIICAFNIEFQSIKIELMLEYLMDFWEFLRKISDIQSISVDDCRIIHDFHASRDLEELKLKTKIHFINKQTADRDRENR